MSVPLPKPVRERPPEESSRRRRETIIILAAGLAVVAFAAWEIRSPTSRGAVGNVFSFLLVNLNIVLLLVMMFLVLRNLFKLFIERRRRVPGSQLRSRLVAAFVTIALVPASVMLVVSYQFVTSNIDDWLSSEVEESLQGAWQLARTYYRESADDALAHARALAGEISARGLASADGNERLRELVAGHQAAYGLGTVQVVLADGKQILAEFNESTPTGVTVFADPDLLAKAKAGEQGTKVESLGEGDLIRGSAPFFAADGETVMGAVIVDFLIERSARRWSEEILVSFRDFRQLKLSKQPFKNLYAITLALASVVVVFSAAWLGMYLARGITEPIVRLAAATGEVAGGNWEVEIGESGGDEIGTLVSSFNSMTAQLKHSHEDLDERRSYIENVLANIDAGVISVDNDLVIGTVNPAAVSLLGLSEGNVEGQPAVEVFETAGFSEVAALLGDLASGGAPSGSRLNVEREEEGRTLQVTATRLTRASGVAAGSVLFFENVSQIVEVQRMEAWREVARRIAHEIKNPLTPIQLSAQRLGRRLSSQLAGADAEVLGECVGTIVQQVDTLKTLVNEFSQFARRSEGPKAAHELNQLVEETMPLYRQARPDIDIRFEPAARLPRVMMHREAVKRALINLLDNAVAAVSSGNGGGPGETAAVNVSTRFDEGLSRVVLEVTDNGPGIPAEQRARVFEPYFSTKDEGTGLGLAIVASVAAEHQAYVRVRDNEPKGSRFVLEFPALEDDALV